MLSAVWVDSDIYIILVLSLVAGLWHKIKNILTSIFSKKSKNS